MSRVTLNGARIFFEVLIFSKLCRINKDRHDNTFRVFPGKRHQTQMTVMQIAHRRHESNMLAVVTPVGERHSQK